MSRPSHSGWLSQEQGFRPANEGEIHRQSATEGNINIQCDERLAHPFIPGEWAKKMSSAQPLKASLIENQLTLSLF